MVSATRAIAMSDVPADEKLSGWGRRRAPLTFSKPINPLKLLMFQYCRIAFVARFGARFGADF
ncbi:MAG: hypothetical protein ACI9GK_002737 [Devosia sp.]|jgi:hypothetical protein